MLEDGGLPLGLDVYESHTVSEFDDNVNVTCQVRKDLAEGEHLRYKYRYRTVYAPGVFITAPNQSDGGENWSNDTYRIEFYATDGHDKPVVADLYYGNGLDNGWKKINSKGPINMSQSTNKVSYWWDVSKVPAGAYYIKVTARQAAGGKRGFDISNTRLQVGRTLGFPCTGATTGTYWVGISPVNVTNHNVLSFWFCGTIGVSDVRLWVKDNSNLTNTVPLTNFIDRIVSLPRRIDIPWANFPTIDRTRVKAVGFDFAAVSNDALASCMRSTWVPLLVQSRVAGPPLVSLEGMPQFSAGETVTNVLTVRNISGSVVTGLTVQAVQEYAETLYWGVAPMLSAYTRAGIACAGASSRSGRIVP